MIKNIRNLVAKFQTQSKTASRGEAAFGDLPQGGGPLCRPPLRGNPKWRPTFDRSLSINRAHMRFLYVLRARDPVFKDPVLRSIERSAPEGFDLCVFLKLLHRIFVCSETFDTLQNWVFENWVLRM